MSSEIWVVIIGAVVTIVVAWINRQTFNAIKATDKKAEIIIEKADEIHELTNSKLTTVEAELKTAQEVVRDLQRAMAEIAQRDLIIARKEGGPPIPVELVRDEEK